MAEDKDHIRKEVLEARKRVPDLMITQRSGIICKELVQTKAYKEAESIWTYVSLPREVQTFPLIEAAWEDGKTVAVPKVIGSDTLRFIELTSYDQLEEGYFHVLEPAYGKAAEDDKALVVMPGVAFDLTGNRLGYGRGFYDRFLAEHPEHPTCAFSFDFALRDKIPAEPHDKKPDFIITDRRMIQSVPEEE